MLVSPTTDPAQTCLSPTSTLAALVDIFREPPHPRESRSLTLVWRSGHAICAERMDMHQFVCGDQYSGWLRDAEDPDDLATCVGYDVTRFCLPDGWRLFAAESASQPKDWFLGLGHADAWQLFGTHDEGIARAIFAQLAVEGKAMSNAGSQTPVPPPAPAGWSLASLLIPSLS